MSSVTQSTLEGTGDPWKDADTLRELYENRNQSEIAEYFQERGHDVTPSTISYWMKKLEVETTHTSHDEGGRNQDPQECVNHDECGNLTPGAKNDMCVSCLDEARRKDREERKENEVRY